MRNIPIEFFPLYRRGGIVTLISAVLVLLLGFINLGYDLHDQWYVKWSKPLINRMIQEADMGALPTIRAAVDLQSRGGEYYGPDGFMELGGYPIIVQSSKASHNVADAQQLWQVSEELTGVTFGPLN